MKLSQLSLADYNQLDSIPVINQDLSASGFTPVANTYYRHTGATTATFTQGVIYLYDTAYHKLGESGGTTLNEYTYTANLVNTSPAQFNHIRNIAKNAAKYGASMEINGTSGDGKTIRLYGEVLIGSNFYGYSGVLYSTTKYIGPIYVEDNGSEVNVIGSCIKNGTPTSFSATSPIKLTIIYYNDVEITA